MKLDDKLSKFYPNLPQADHITLKNLANMTSGYADYVYQPEVLQGVNLDPFRQWTPEQLIKIGITAPMMFEPGTNFGYSHTNYVILGRVLEKITGMPLAQAMQKYIFTPMGLKQTQSIETPQIPEPVLHTFSSERRADLHVPADVFFYEEATFWNPSWTTAEGAVQITDITDMSKSMEMVGSGTLLSKPSWQAQVGPNLVGFGHKDPKCPGLPGKQQHLQLRSRRHELRSMGGPDQELRRLRRDSRLPGVEEAHHLGGDFLRSRSI